MRYQALASVVLSGAFLGSHAAAQPVGGDVCGSLASVASPGQGAAGRMLSAVGASGSAAFAVGRYYPRDSGHLPRSSIDTTDQFGAALRRRLLGAWESSQSSWTPRWQRRPGPMRGLSGM